ncbi:hypothetical protein ACFVW2_16250 [Streptomyces sp. NPDC058171]
MSEDQAANRVPTQTPAVERVTSTRPAGRERELAVADWLLAAARDRNQARHEWATLGIALLTCGVIFSALRMPGDLVRAAARTDDDEGVATFLRHSLDGGPAIRDVYGDRYYVLAPVGAGRAATVRTGCPEYLGQDCYLGVPEPSRTTPPGRAHWCVPMDVPVRLCAPQRLTATVSLGQERLRAAQAESNRPDTARPVIGPPR